MSSENCAICMKSSPCDFVLSCKHTFHATCLYASLQGRTTFPCPMCRNELSGEEQQRLDDDMMAYLSTGEKLPIEDSQPSEEESQDPAASGGGACVFVDLTRENSV